LSPQDANKVEKTEALSKSKKNPAFQLTPFARRPSSISTIFPGRAFWRQAIQAIHYIAWATPERRPPPGIACCGRPFQISSEDEFDL
jgi:hypothetical protein